MRRRLAGLVAPFVALGLLAAGCGGGDNTTTTSGGDGPAASSSDATAIIASITQPAEQGPQRVAVNLNVALKGTLKDPMAGALLGSGPISLDVSGPADASGKKAELTFAVKAGKINLSGVLRVVGEKAYLRLAGKWYEVPLDDLGQNQDVARSLDPARLLAALGDPSDLVDNATVVGGEDIDGIATDHVTADVDTAALVTAIARVAKEVDPKGSPVTPEQITEATAQIQKYVRSARVDLWIGQETKQIHRFKLDLDAALDEKAKASSGLDGFTAAITVGATPVESPDVQAPDGALPSSQLQTDIGPIILSGLGGATP